MKVTSFEIKKTLKIVFPTLRLAAMKQALQQAKFLYLHIAKMPGNA